MYQLSMFHWRSHGNLGVRTVRGGVEFPSSSMLLFENMGFVIRPNLHRNSGGGVGDVLAYAVVNNV